MTGGKSVKTYETTMRELSPREAAMVGGAEFTWSGLQEGMAVGFIAGTVAGFAAFGYAYGGTPALMGGVGGLIGGASYLWGELID
jgi:hypothetical protein